MTGRATLRITREELSQALAVGDWATKFPPVLDAEQAAALLQIPISTLYQWRSQGRLSGCCQKVGKHLRFFRDRLLLRVMNEGI